MMSTLSNTNTTIGLFGNMIFESINTAIETGWPGRTLPIYSDFEAPAITFHVDCGLVDNGIIRQNGISTGDAWNVTFNMGENPLLPINFPRDQGVTSEATINWLGKYFAITTWCARLYIHSHTLRSRSSSVYHSLLTTPRRISIGLVLCFREYYRRSRSKRYHLES